MLPFELSLVRNSQSPLPSRYCISFELGMSEKTRVFVARNPRGITRLWRRLHSNNFPSHDYDDLMSGVDAVVARGHVDPQRLYVTGGSGGGILSSWIIGKTDRFQAAAVIKPVINWYSFALTSDHYNFLPAIGLGRIPGEIPRPISSDRPCR